MGTFFFVLGRNVLFSFSVFQYEIKTKPKTNKKRSLKTKQKRVQYETKTIAWMSPGGHAAMRSRPGWAGHRRGVEAQSMCVWIIFVVLH